MKYILITLVIAYFAIAVYGDLRTAYAQVELDITTKYIEVVEQTKWYSNENRCIAKLVSKGVPRKHIKRVNGSCVDERRTWNQSARMGDL
ncbi:MAG: hypothetical protein HRU18_02730 [Pseudoalteromonas sp.]|uniref:hypothetical protein n=1 Tax=Pseudoalteromonas sp. TaxID=53249 RepID=UPI001D3DA8F5|nr:hypothetical protein [Pseudoalteromonas sp.]NRA77099.1 hypothetical protein [Pseudoalteromonas sp.]